MKKQVQNFNKSDLVIHLSRKFPSLNDEIIVEGIDLVLQEIINTFEGKDIPKGSVSMTLRFIFQSKAKSLLESDINGSIQMILKLLEKRLNAKVRS